VKGDPANTQIMYAPLSERKDVVTSVTISNSGQLLCVGLSSGMIAQYSLGLPEGTKPKINAVSRIICLYISSNEISSDRTICDEKACYE
jgi:hypothetical protein